LSDADGSPLFRSRKSANSKKSSRKRSRYESVAAPCAPPTQEPALNVRYSTTRFTIWGDRPIRNGEFSCSDYSIMPEYRTPDGDWKQFRSRLMACDSNIFIETPILPGNAAEGDFTLPGLAPQFDTSLLHPAGKYEFQFRFHSCACLESPDGTFCIQSPRNRSWQSPV